MQRHFEPAGRGELLPILDAVELLQRNDDVRGCVQGQSGVMFRVSVAVRVLRVFLLQLRRVEQDHFSQLGRGAGAVDSAGEALSHEAGDVAGVIHVGVREHERAHRCGLEGGLLPVQIAQLTAALEHAAVDQQPRCAGCQQMS